MRLYASSRLPASVILLALLAACDGDGGSSTSMNGAAGTTSATAGTTSTTAGTTSATAGTTSAVAGTTSAVASAPVATTANVGGSVTGLLSGRSVVLQNDGGQSITLSGNAAFNFPAITTGFPYNVSVLSQPAGQTCVVSNGNGIVGAVNIDSVSVACSNNTYNIGVTVAGLTATGLVLQNNGGDNLSIIASGAVNFLMPVASGSSYAVTVLTQPLGQQCSISSGAGTVGATPVTVAVSCTQLSAWTWMNGSPVVDAFGVYGTLGSAASVNVPGARSQPVSWTDSSGNFWLFGGTGYDSQGNEGLLNDLWEYSAGQWKWMSGSNTSDATGQIACCTAIALVSASSAVKPLSAASSAGIYATQGVAAAGNVPGGRSGATSWADSSGNLWLFGGNGWDSTGNQGSLNDLWAYSADSGQWTWVGGSNTVNATGAYGTQGVAAPGNVPGARNDAISWTDSSGNVWLFGGLGYDSAGNYGFMNDLWEFRIGLWTWVSGSSTVNAIGTYGTQGSAAADNVPGARSGAIPWADPSGNLWLFGGNGYDSAGNFGPMNDLWEFSAGRWVWVSGSSTIDAIGIYGTQGVAAAGNVPSPRSNATSWTDASGNLWLFGGGQGFQKDLLKLGKLALTFDDLWEYSAGQWKWVSGSTGFAATGSYGTQGIPAAGNVPGARENAVSWIDTSGNFWLFGGEGYDSQGNQDVLNDLWKYNP